MSVTPPRENRLDVREIARRCRKLSRGRACGRWSADGQLQGQLLLLDDRHPRRRGEPTMSPRGPVEPAWRFEGWVGEAPHGHTGQVREHL